MSSSSLCHVSSHFGLQRLPKYFSVLSQLQSKYLLHKNALFSAPDNSPKMIETCLHPLKRIKWKLNKLKPGRGVGSREQRLLDKAESTTALRVNLWVSMADSETPGRAGGAGRDLRLLDTWLLWEKLRILSGERYLSFGPQDSHGLWSNKHGLLIKYHQTHNRTSHH